MSQPLKVLGDFPFPPERYFDLYFNQAFVTFLGAELELARYDLLSLEQTDDAWVRSVLVEPRMNLPWLMQRALGTRHINYIETSSWTPGTGTLRWSVATNVMSEHIQIGGTTHITLSTTGCCREVDGTVAVSVVGLGPKIETWVVQKISESYERGARLMARYSRGESDGSIQ